MKKLGMILTALTLVFTLGVGVAGAEYLPQYDKYVEVDAQKARQLADAIGLKKVPLGEKTAELSFEFQERIINAYELKTGKEFDHYYIWLTINGVPVLAIDPPQPLI